MWEMELLDKWVRKRKNDDNGFDLKQSYPLLAFEREIEKGMKKGLEEKAERETNNTRF